MDMRHLEEFVYTAETGSFKQTASHFFVSRSVISRHISALEDITGARLFERDRHMVRLTDAGEVFYREAKIVLRDWNSALERVREVSEKKLTLVRVGYLRNAARPVLAHFVREMNRRYPDVRLSLVCMEHHELVRALAEHNVDLALAVNISPELSGGYRSTSIYKDHYTVVCAKDQRLAREKGWVDLDDLRGLPLLIPDSYVYGGTSSFIKDVVDDETMAISRAFYSDADILTLKVETEGLFAFSSTMNNILFRDRLAVLPIVDADTSFEVSAFYHDDFDGEGFEACKSVFDWCNKHMKDWQPGLALDA